MNNFLPDAIKILESLPPSGDERDNATITAILNILNSSENAYGLLVSLVISAFYQADSRHEAFVRFLGVLTSSWAQYEDVVAKLMAEAKDEVKH